MPITCNCEHCSAVYRLADGMAGKRAKCKQCGNVFTINREPPPPAIEPIELDLAPEPSLPSAEERVAENAERLRSYGVLPLDEHLERGMSALVEGDYPEAAKHYYGAVQQSDSDQTRSYLIESLKRQYLPLLILRTLGIACFDAPTEGISRARWFFRGVFSATLALGLQIAQHHQETSRLGLWVMASVGVLFLIGQLVDLAGTLYVFRLPYGDLAMRPGMKAGIWAGLSYLLLSLVCALCIPLAPSGVLILSAVILLMLARPAQLTLSARPTPLMYLMIVYIGLLHAAGVTFLSKIDWAEAMDFSMRYSRFAGVLSIFFILGAISTRAVRGFLALFFSTGRKFFDDDYQADPPGGIPLSTRRLRELEPKLFGLRGLLFTLFNLSDGVSARDEIELIRGHLMKGAAAPAMVVSTQPLVIAAYSDDMDCVALLEFDVNLPAARELTRGQRLLTVNTYFPTQYRHLGQDLEIGPDGESYFGNFKPLIADLLTDDREALAATKRKIRPEYWERLQSRLVRSLERSARPRLGTPLWCGEARSLQNEPS